MKTVTIAQAVEILVAASNSRVKSHAATGLSKTSLHYIHRGARRISRENAIRLLNAVRERNPEVTSLDCGDRIEHAPSVVEQLADRVAKLEATVRNLSARVEVVESRTFRRLAAEARLSLPPQPFGRGNS